MARLVPWHRRAQYHPHRWAAIKPSWPGRFAGPNSPKSRSWTGRPIQLATFWKPNAVTRVSRTAAVSSFRSPAVFLITDDVAGRPANTRSSSSGTWDRSRPDPSSSCLPTPNSPIAGDPPRSVKSIPRRCCAFTAAARYRCVSKPASISIAEQMQHDAAPVRPHPMLEQIHALPGPQRQLALVNRDRQLGLRERRPDMRRHIVRPLRGVPVQAGYPPEPGA